MDLGDEFGTIHPWHFLIHNDEIKTICLDQLYASPPVPRLPAIVVRIKEGTQILPHIRVVIHDKHSRFASGRRNSTRRFWPPASERYQRRSRRRRGRIPRRTIWSHQLRHQLIEFNGQLRAMPTNMRGIRSETTTNLYVGGIDAFEWLNTSKGEKQRCTEAIKIRTSIYSRRIPRLFR